MENRKSLSILPDHSLKRGGYQDKRLGIQVYSKPLTVEKVFLGIFWVLLHAGLASQALRKLFAGHAVWPAFRAKHETTIF